MQLEAANGTPNGYSTFKTFPKELTSLIFLFIPPPKIPPLAIVCKEWKTILADDYFWLQVICKYFPSIPKKKNEKALATAIRWLKIRCRITSGDNLQATLKKSNCTFDRLFSDRNRFAITKDRFINHPLRCWNIRRKSYAGSIGITSDSEIRSIVRNNSQLILAYKNGLIRIEEAKRKAVQFSIKKSYLPQNLFEIKALNGFLYANFRYYNSPRKNDIYRISLDPLKKFKQKDVAYGASKYFSGKNLIGWIEEKKLTVICNEIKNPLTFTIKDQTLKNLHRLENGKWLFIYQNNRIEVWDKEMKKILSEKHLHSDQKLKTFRLIRTLPFRNFMFTLHTTSCYGPEKALSLWQIKPLHCNWSFPIYSLFTWNVVYDLLLTQHRDYTLKIWDLHTGKHCHTYKEIAYTSKVKYMDGKLVVLSKVGDLLILDFDVPKKFQDYRK